MFGIGANELLLILLFGFLIFGPDKLPAIAKTIGQAIGKFKSAQEEMNNVIKTEVYDPDSQEPFKNPLDTLSKLEDDAKKEDKGESFTERKARYDKQRAAKKTAEEKSTAANVASGAVGAAVAESADEGKKAPAAEKPAAASAEKKPAVDIDALYGAKPAAKKPATAKSAAAAKPTESVKSAAAAKPDSATKPAKSAPAKPASDEEKGE